MAQSCRALAAHDSLSGQKAGDERAIIKEVWVRFEGNVLMRINASLARPVTMNFIEQVDSGDSRG
jgi:hypothetical protein